MQAHVGDQLRIRGAHVGSPERAAEIVEVRGRDGEPPYVVRWDDGHQSLLMPGTDAVVKARPSRGSARKPS